MSKLDDLARTTAFDAPTIERTAKLLNRAAALLEEDYDGWFPAADLDENWQTLLVESERDRYREVAAQFLTAGFLPGSLQEAP